VLHLQTGWPWQTAFTQLTQRARHGPAPTTRPDPPVRPGPDRTPVETTGQPGSNKQARNPTGPTTTRSSRQTIT
jgi:hypothetical protein